VEALADSRMTALMLPQVSAVVEAVEEEFAMHSKEESVNVVILVDFHTMVLQVVGTEVDTLPLEQDRQEFVTLFSVVNAIEEIHVDSLMMIPVQ